MFQLVRAIVPLSTAALVAVSVFALLPWLGHSAPHDAPGSQLGGLCGFQIGGSCGFGGFSGGLNLGGLQFGGFQQGGFNVGGFNVGGGFAQGGLQQGGFNLGSGFNQGGFNLGSGFQQGGFQFGGVQFGGQIGGLAQGGFQQGGLNFGGGFNLGIFVLLAPESTVEVGQRLPIVFAWETPAPRTWQELRTLELRLRDQSGAIVFWVRWDEASNTFNLVDPATGNVRATASPGSPTTLETGLVTLHLDGAQVQTSGPTGQTVALFLPLSFKEGAAGRAFLVEEAATGDQGEVQGFGAVGIVTVLARQAQEQRVNDDEDEDRRQRRSRNNATRGEDESRTEGNVIGVRCAAPDPVPTLARGFIVEPDVVPYALIANRDEGAQKILLIREAAKLCRHIRVGDYLEAEGEKQSEVLFHADDVSVQRVR